MVSDGLGKKTFKQKNYLLPCAHNILSVVHDSLSLCRSNNPFCFIFVKIRTLMCASISESGKDNSMTTSSLMVL